MPNVLAVRLSGTAELLARKQPGNPIKLPAEKIQAPISSQKVRQRSLKAVLIDSSWVPLQGWSYSNVAGFVWWGPLQGWSYSNVAGLV